MKTITDEQWVTIWCIFDLITFHAPLSFKSLHKWSGDAGQGTLLRSLIEQQIGRQFRDQYWDAFNYSFLLFTTGNNKDTFVKPMPEWSEQVKFIQDYLTDAAEA